ncbi:hypothetical protein Cob_v007883 [Colletotrichum orbiculare MAFF 240422]|uniref:Uncharacterized protein n=1 Tax=Colletotrichum orbiculare (strain 104-T / ATCC 96160 / CBS 514.97 / LARS 414 / MAFF 240422) TaxID=1213857 RepID=A0A484FM61_COLOR|nr:hypothetical protein Cob_v007883 [Colletotrichum orbiculare MAFF 240422]
MPVKCTILASPHPDPPAALQTRCRDWVNQAESIILCTHPSVLNPRASKFLETVLMSWSIICYFRRDIRL